MLRIVLFLLTNLAIMLVLSVVASIFGLDRWAYAHSGINLAGMLVFCALFGIGGSLISLLLSKTMAKMSVGAQVIDQPRNAERAEQTGVGVYLPPELLAPETLYNTVTELLVDDAPQRTRARDIAAGLRGRPAAAVAADLVLARLADAS